jgi:hypothetical protein
VFWERFDQKKQVEKVFLFEKIIFFELFSTLTRKFLAKNPFSTLNIEVLGTKLFSYA